MPIADQSILDCIADHPGAGREDIRRNVAPEFSTSTVCRTLKRLVDKGGLDVSGKVHMTSLSRHTATISSTGSDCA